MSRSESSKTFELKFVGIRASSIEVWAKKMRAVTAVEIAHKIKIQL